MNTQVLKKVKELQARKRNEEFAIRFREQLRKKGICCSQLSKILGVSKSRVHGWYLGSYLPNLLSASRIGAILGCSIDYLLHGNGWTKSFLTPEENELLHFIFEQFCDRDLTRYSDQQIECLESLINKLGLETENEK